MAKGRKASQAPGHLPSLPADCRDALEWFVGNFGLYVGSVRGLFLSDFNEEHEAGLEASIINLKSRGFTPTVITGETMFKQAEFLYDQSHQGGGFGKPLASKIELDLTGSDVVVLKDLSAPESDKHLWYFYNHVIYPRALSGKATVVTTPLAYEEFLRYGAGCNDVDFGGKTVTWEKLFWLIETSMINLEQFRMMRQEGLPPLLKAEWYLWMSLKERGLDPVPQHVLGDYMLDLALIDKNRRLDIEVDGLTSVRSYDRQTEEAKRNLVLLSDDWQILRFTTAEILNNHAGCAEVVEDVWRDGRKKLPLGRLITGQSVADIPELPIDDDTQVAAITHGGGPAAVIGGPGSGKTFCITQRVGYLLSQGVSPESVLVITHSPETLKPVRDGLEQMLDKQTMQRLHLWAWHDLGLKILKENLGAIKRKAPLKVEPNPQKIIQRILQKHKKELDPNTLELSTGLDEFAVAAAISIYKANLVSPKTVKEMAKDDIESLIARVYQSYEDQLQRANRIDRDDMVTLAVLILLERPDIRARYQCHFDFVLVDEYQDATPALDMLARLLAAPQDNLYLVGDEDQSIYETKGAVPRLLAEISHRLPQTRCYTLERNWRSHPALVDNSRQLIFGLMRRRTQKDMYPAWGDPGTLAIIGPTKLAGEKEEAEWVAGEIQLLVDGGRSAGDIAVLYRYHRYAGILEEVLGQRGVRCVASRPESGVVPDEIEDMLAFLRLVMDPDGPKAKEAFERVSQLRTKEVDPKLSSTIAGFAEANNLSYLKAVEIYSEATADQSCRDLEQLVRIIRTMHQENLPPAETIALVKRTQRLSDYYKSVHVPPGVNYEPLRKLNMLEEEARKFTTVSEFVKHRIAMKQQATSALAGESGVHVLTLHEAKGLEFPVVFVVGLAEGLFPAESATDLEEERRLCYVGFSRAREMLYLSMPAKFNDVDLQPSSFLAESRHVTAPTPPAAALPEPLAAPSVVVPELQVPAIAQAPVREQAQVQMPQLPQAEPPPPPPSGPPAKGRPGREPVVAPLPAASAPPAKLPPPPPPAPIVQPSAPPSPPGFTARPPRAETPPAPSALPDYASDNSAGGAGPPPDYGTGEAQPDYGSVAGEPLEQAEHYAAPAEYQAPGPPDGALQSHGTQPICPICGARLEAGARFCGECGQHLTVRIPACALCGSPLEPTAKFCGECGTPLSHFSANRPLSPGGIPGAVVKRDQHGWVQKLIKFLEPDV